MNEALSLASYRWAVTNLHNAVIHQAAVKICFWTSAQRADVEYAHVSEVKNKLLGVDFDESYVSLATKNDARILITQHDLPKVSTRAQTSCFF